MTSLLTYFKKRNLKKSGKPKPKIKSSNFKKIFVVHEHHARKKHYDFRLAMNGVLKPRNSAKKEFRGDQESSRFLASWAIPKSPPSTKGIKRLAIQVENHPLAYAKFEGIIEKGNYGAGKVIIWDKGTYELKNKGTNKIEFVLHGKKLKGNYVLIKTSYGNKPEKSWLFFKLK